MQAAAVTPTGDELHPPLQTVIAWLMKMLTRRGGLVENTGDGHTSPDLVWAVQNYC